ncbi:hypothetical protein fugu_003477 [Takifugu bimaculatus]|uniref:DNA replication complex GINS protein PSF2 N-terminal domain-containing protein n=1 Tax=Takifugu bimaculatus TaxID=433685 RepID=A0A4Z2BHG8_9TELE|nr:hypothetical protein fugu_003477 [Takifugu bimaculatus]
MDPSEAEFLAEKETITIIPNFSLDKVFLIGGDLGPFNPGLPVDVPVWFALNLKQRQKCRIVPPAWMDVEKLEEMRDLERREGAFTPVPSPFYMELSKLLLNYASDNIPKADEIRTAGQRHLGHADRQTAPVCRQIHQSDGGSRQAGQLDADGDQHHSLVSPGLSQLHVQTPLQSAARLQ